MSCLATGPIFRARFLPAFAILQLSVVVCAVAGVQFHAFGASSVFGPLALAASVAALLSPRQRDLLTRGGLLILAAVAVRAWGSLLHPNDLGMVEFALLWLTLVLMVLAALNVCLFPLGLGVFGALRTFLPTIATQEYLHDKRLWYLNWLVFWPLVTLCAPLGISLGAWAFRLSSRLGPTLELHAVSGVALGVFVPLGVLTVFIFSLRDAAERPGGTGIGKIGPVGLKRAGLLVLAATTYAYGLWLEHGGAQMYALWSVCWAGVFLTFVCLRKLSSFLALGPEAVPARFLGESRGRRSWREATLIFLWLYLSGFAYYQLLASIFRR